MFYILVLKYLNLKKIMANKIIKSEEEERLYFRKQISERKVLKAIKANTDGLENSQIALRASAYELLQLGAKYFMEQQKK